MNSPIGFAFGNVNGLGSRKLVDSEVAVTDALLAAYLHYLGYFCVRCDTADRNTSFTFRVPSEDFKIAETEYTSDETTLYLAGFIRSFKVMQSLQRKSREQMGVFTTREYSSR
jgi:hypothetical protein